MAYSLADRRKAERLFVVEGLTVEQVAQSTGIARSTLLRWSGQQKWAEQRRLRDQLHVQTLEMADALAREAIDTADPQQAFAAQRAIAMVKGTREAAIEAEYPPPAEVATALIDVLANHLEIGPVIRRHRQEVVRLTMSALRQFDVPDPSAGAR